MHSTRTLTEEDLALLPSFAKAFACGCDTSLNNERISLSPSSLQFLHDQPSSQVAQVTLWNRSPRQIEVELEALQQPNIFSAFCDKKRAYGGSQITLCIKCTPGGRKLAFDCLPIRITWTAEAVGLDGTKDLETLFLPLQLCPGNGWFSIPKVIVMPPASVGHTVEVGVKLPPAPEPEKFFVAIKTSTPHHSHALTVTPFSGVLGGPNPTPELVFRYTPKEYTTLVHVIELHFPGVDITPHEIVVYGRAIPGIESEVITRETVGLENFVAFARKKQDVMENRKLPEPKMKIRTHPLDPDEEDLYTGLNGEDLTKPAGVMHFLIRKDDRMQENSKTLGPTGLTRAQEQKAYSELENNFKDQIKRERIAQKNIQMQLQPHFGGDHVTAGSKMGQMIIQERNLHRAIYELGLAKNGASNEKDLNRNKLKASNQRSIRQVGEQILGKPNLSDNEIAEIEAEGCRITHELALRRFLQASYVIMMRYRVSKRMPKIRILIQNMKAVKQLRSPRQGQGRGPPPTAVVSGRQ